MTITSVPVPISGSFNQNPVWDAETNSLYFIDLLGEYVFRYSPDKNLVQSVTFDGLFHPGIFRPIRGSDVLFMTTANDTGILIEWDGHSPTASFERTLFRVGPNQYINDGYAFENGDIDFGTYNDQYCADEGTNSLYRRVPNVRVALERQAGGFIAVTGIAVVGGTAYAIDSCTKILWAFDHDLISGRLSEPHFVL